MGGYVIATFDPWPAGATLTLKYLIDGDSSYSFSTETPATGSLFTLFPIPRRFINLTFGADGTCGATTPYVSSLQAYVDPLSNERPVGG